MPLGDGVLIFQHRFRAGVSTVCVGACDPQTVGNGGSFLAGAKRRQNFLGATERLFDSVRNRSS